MSRSNTALYRRFWRATAGVAMIEFALIFPFFFVLLFGGIEVTRLLLIQQRLERTGYFVGDTISQYMPATVLAASGEINKNQLLNNVFPHYSRVMDPYDNHNRQAIIVTSVQKVAGVKRIRWQIASPLDRLNGCDGNPTPNCVKSIVNGLSPSAISSAVKNTRTSFPPEIENTLTTLPEGSNLIVAEAFYYYQPLLQDLFQRVGSAGGEGMMGFDFFIPPRIYIKRTFFSPRNGVMQFLPPDFPVS